MLNFELKEKHITQFDTITRRKVQFFLEEQGLDFDEDVQYTIAIFHGENMIATGSFDHDVIKCIAVASDYKGYGLMNKIISELMNEQFRRGFEHLFVYTKPENKELFCEWGFYKIMEIPGKVVFLENKRDGIFRYLEIIKKQKVSGRKVAALVMNCNPFTLGHKYLIEKAASENEFVHIFIVSENKSQFSFDARYRLVLEGTKDLPNVFVHKGSKYIISAATFPSYFLKKSSEVVTTHAMLELSIFAEYIAPALGITCRYVGEETTCAVTAEYNRVMKELLPKYGITVTEIPRLTIADSQVSASKVRALLEKNDYRQMKELVPMTTYHHLVNYQHILH